MSEMFVIEKGRDFFVRPAQASVRPGETLRVSNLTRQRVLLFFPELSHEIIEVGGLDSTKGGSPYADITIPRDATPGFSPFAAFAAEARDFCEGESTPGVIITK